MSAAKYLKIHGFIERYGGVIGFADFQKNGSEKPADQRPKQGLSHTFPAYFGFYGEVEDLNFVARDAAKHHKSGDVVFGSRDQELVIEVIRDIPLRGLRARRLNRRDFRQIGCSGAADLWHICSMFHVLVPLLFFFGQPFWEAKPPEKWTDAEIATIRTNSPWAQQVGTPPQVSTIYLATAAPIEAAEAELRLRFKNELRSRNNAPELDPDYLDYMRDHRADCIVLAVTYPTLAGLGHADESKRMEEESVMIVGRKEYKIIGHFPPTPSQHVLRLIFPRMVKASDKSVVFRLLLAGLKFPERELEFRVKDLMYQGKLEM